MTDQEPPPDPKPRPKYGELAPDGWRWVPPKDAANPDGVHPVTPEKPTRQRAPGHDQQLQQPHRGSSWPPPGSNAPRTTPLWDRNLTVILLFIGVIGMVTSIGVMDALPQSLQMIYTQDKLGTYTPAGNVSALILASSIAQAILWIASLVVAILLLRRGRHAFYIPIVAGIIAIIVLFSFIGVIVTNDHTLLNYYSG